MALRRREPSGRWRYDEEQGRKETSVARRRATSKEVGCKGKEARYDEEQGARRPQWQGGGLGRQT